MTKDMDKDQATPAISGMVYMWQGYWTGWVHVYAELRGSRLAFAASAGGESVGDAIDFVAGCDIEFLKVAERGASHSADGTATLSFVVKTNSIARHVHLRLPTLTVRDQWAVALQLAACAVDGSTQDPALTRFGTRLQSMQWALEALNLQLTRLALLHETSLGAYPEIFALLGDARAASLTVSAAVSSASQSAQWLAQVDEFYHDIMERETQSQIELLKIAKLVLGQDEHAVTRLLDDVDQVIDDSLSPDDAPGSLAALQCSTSTVAPLLLYNDCCRAQASILLARASAVASLAASGIVGGEVLANKQADLSAISGPAIGSGSVKSQNTAHTLPVMGGIPQASPLNGLDSASVYAWRANGRPLEYLYPPPPQPQSGGRALSQASSAASVIASAMCSVRDSCQDMTRFLTNHVAMFEVQSRRLCQRTLVLQKRLLAASGAMDRGEEEESPPISTIDSAALSTELASFSLAASHDVVFDVFFSSAPKGLKALHSHLNYYDTSIEPWNSTGLTANRKVRLTVDVSTPMGLKSAINCEDQTLDWRPDRRGFTVSATITSTNVPYSTTFANQIRYYIVSTGPSECHVTMSADLEWLAKPYFGAISSMIEGQARQSMLDYGEQFVRFVTDYLATEKEKEGLGHAIPLVDSHVTKEESKEICCERPASVGQSEKKKIAIKKGLLYDIRRNAQALQGLSGVFALLAVMTMGMAVKLQQA